MSAVDATALEPDPEEGDEVLDPLAETLEPEDDEVAPQPVQLRFALDAWSYLGRFYGPQMRDLALLGAVAVAQALVLLPPLYCIRTAFDVAIPHRDLKLLLLLGVGVIAARVFASLLAVIARSLGAQIAKTAVAGVRLDLLAHLYDLSRAWFGSSEHARTYNRITQLSERVDQATTLALSDAGPAFVVILAMSIWLVHVNLWLVLMALPVAPIGWVIAAMARRKVRWQVRIFQETYERFGKGVLFVLNQMDLTKMRGFEAGELARQREAVDEVADASRRMAVSYSFYSQAQSVVGGLGAVVILVGGGAEAIDGALTAGDLIAFLAAAAILNTYLTKVISLAPDLIAAEEALIRLRELRTSGPLEPYPPGGEHIGFAGRVSLIDVSVSFRGKPVLNSVNFDIGPGDNIAIVGANGAGKTTLLNLILGFLKPDDGEMLAEGKPFDEVDLRALRREIGVVPQKPTFFAGTIADNIAYGLSHVGRDEIAAAAESAGAHGFIRSLPHGYDTEIGEGGVLVSGGEAQRLAIARALVGRPKLLLLDEPTNHLDAEAVSAIMGRLTRGPDHTALLSVSHDAEVIGLAKTVYRLEGGALTKVRGDRR
jgi:ABC-type bacteriocin/lantibiotic exporter with double-glycine peptidase domain